MKKFDTGAFCIECASDVVRGDVIVFSESTAPGRPAHQRSPFMRTIAAQVLADDYGRGMIHHSLSLKVLACESHSPVAPGHTIQRRLESLAKCGVKRKPWDDESKRPGASKAPNRAGASALEVGGDSWGWSFENRDDEA